MKLINWAEDILTEYSLAFTNLIALTGTFGSLAFSELMGLEPCILCWYQRILLYPIAIITAIAILRKEKPSNMVAYILALSIPGVVIAAYQYFTQMTGGGLVEICSAGKSCSEIDFEVLGFITIPFLSLVAFLAITVLSLLVIRKSITSKK